MKMEDNISFKLLSEDIKDELNSVPIDKEHVIGSSSWFAKLQLLIVMGQFKQANEMVKATLEKGVDEGNAKFVCISHLFESFMNIGEGNPDIGKAFLNKALSIIPQINIDFSFKLIIGVVGIEVSLLVKDVVDAVAFLRDIREIPNIQDDPLIKRNLELWKSRIAMLNGNLVSAEDLLNSIILPEGEEERCESKWKLFWFKGEIELLRGNRERAKKFLKTSADTLRNISNELPEKLKAGYLSVFSRKRVFDCLESISIREPSALLRGVKSTARLKVPRIQHEIVGEFRKILQRIRALNLPNELGPLLDLILDYVIRFCGAERGIIVLMQGDNIKVEASRHFEGRLLKEEEMLFSRTIATRVAKSGETIVLEEAIAAEEFQDKDSVRDIGRGSVMCVPLTVERHKLGALYLDDQTRSGAFTEESVNLAKFLSEQISLAIEHTNLLSRVVHDGLTGAYTHNFFQEQIEYMVSLSRRHQRSCGLLIIDIDHFKLINDNHGHDFGNFILREVVKELRSTLRKPDTIAMVTSPSFDEIFQKPGANLGRFGGDEFEVLLPETDVEGVGIVANRILNRIRKRKFKHNDSEIYMTLSIGGACFPQHASTTGTLFQRADDALYRAKREGRDRVRIWGETVPVKDTTITGTDIDNLVLTKEGRLAIGMIDRILQQGSELEPLLKSTLAIMAQVTGAERGFLILRDEKRQDQFKFVLNLDEEEVTTENLPISFSVVDRVFENKKGILIEDTSIDEEFAQQQSFVDLGLRSVISVPIPIREKEQGIVYLDICSGDQRFTQEDLTLLQIASRRIAKWIDSAHTLLQKNEQISVLEETLQKGLAELRSRYKYDEIIGNSPKIKENLKLMDSFVDVNYPVLIQGETGTGKELVAKAIHYNGKRKDKPFITVDCASIAETLMESELFGHVKGAFTGANEDKVGLFELANKGTLFLDEIENMSDGMQSKLLRVLEEKKVRRVGGKHTIPVDVRIISATNQNLENLSQKGKFRQDLLFRLNILTINLPPLRERTEDIPLLVEHFMEEVYNEMCDRQEKKKEISKEAMNLMTTYSWPGNVRQLRSEVVRAYLASEEVIKPENLSHKIRGGEVEEKSISEGSFQEKMSNLERELIRDELKKNDYNIRATARSLKMDRKTLTRRISNLKIDIPMRKK